MLAQLQDAPKRPQDTPGTPPGPPPRGPKRTPRRPQEAPKGAQEGREREQREREREKERKKGRKERTKDRTKEENEKRQRQDMRALLRAHARRHVHGARIAISAHTQTDILMSAFCYIEADAYAHKALILAVSGDMRQRVTKARRSFKNASLFPSPFVGRPRAANLNRPTKGGRYDRLERDLSGLYWGRFFILPPPLPGLTRGPAAPRGVGPYRALFGSRRLQDDFKTTRRRQDDAKTSSKDVKTLQDGSRSQLDPNLAQLGPILDPLGAPKP